MGHFKSSYERAERSCLGGCLLQSSLSEAEKFLAAQGVNPKVILESAKQATTTAESAITQAKPVVTKAIDTVSATSPEILLQYAGGALALYLLVRFLLKIPALKNFSKFSNFSEFSLSFIPLHPKQQFLPLGWGRELRAGTWSCMALGLTALSFIARSGESYGGWGIHTACVSACTTKSRARETAMGDGGSILHV
jgi:hypothetical protein